MVQHVVQMGLPVVTRSMDINLDPVCGRITDPDKASSSNSAGCHYGDPGGSSGHLALYRPNGSLTLEYQHGLRCWPRLAMVTGTVNINTDLDCSRVTDPNMALGSGPRSRRHQGTGWQAGRPHQPLPGFHSSDLPLSTNHPASRDHHIFAPSWCLALGGRGGFFSLPRADGPRRVCLCVSIPAHRS